MKQSARDQLVATAVVLVLAASVVAIAQFAGGDSDRAVDLHGLGHYTAPDPKQLVHHVNPASGTPDTTSGPVGITGLTVETENRVLVAGSNELRGLPKSTMRVDVSVPTSFDEVPIELVAGKNPVLVWRNRGKIARTDRFPEVEFVTVGAPIRDAVGTRDGAVWFERGDDHRLCRVAPTELRAVCVGVAPHGQGRLLTMADRLLYLDPLQDTLSELTESGLADRFELPDDVPDDVQVATVNPASEIVALDPDKHEVIVWAVHGREASTVRRVELNEDAYTEPVVGAHSIVVVGKKRRDLVVVDKDSGKRSERRLKHEPIADPAAEPDGRVYVDTAKETVFVEPDGATKAVKTDVDPPKPSPTPSATARATRPPAVTHPVQPRPPGPPGDPTAVAGDARITLTWLPAADGGSPIVEYVVSWSASGGGAPGTMHVSGGSTSADITQLANGTEYVVAVYARNVVDRGPAATAPPVTPSADVPLPPSSVRATGVLDGTITVSWQRADGRGRSITGYDVTAVAGNRRRVVARQTTGTRIVVGEAAGLTIGGTYSFVVVSVNDAGRASPPSAATDAVTLARPANPPVGLTAAPAGGSQLRLTWSAPAANGGTIRDYVVERSGAPSITVTGTEAMVTGLQNGTTYTFAVRARTDVDRATVDGQQATVQGVPGEPAVASGLSASLVADRTVRVSFTVDTRQSGNSFCRVYFSGVEKWSGGCAGTTAMDIGNLAYATTYDVYAVAENSYGTGPSSNHHQVRTNDPPTVTIRKGPARSSTDCSDPSCAWVDVTITNFAPGVTYSGNCYATTDPDGYQPFQITTNSSGTGTARPCYYGYPNREFWIVVNGVSSNRITW